MRCLLAWREAVRLRPDRFGHTRCRSEKLPSGETGNLRDPSELPRPALWPKPTPGAQPVPISGRDEGSEKEQIAKQRLPLARVGIGICVVAAIVLGVAVGRQSRLLALLGVITGAIGGGIVLKSRLMDAATIGQSVKDHRVLAFPAPTTAVVIDVVATEDQPGLAQLDPVAVPRTTATEGTPSTRVLKDASLFFAGELDPRRR